VTVARRVVNVTPRTRTESFIDAVGLVSVAIGWLFVAFSAMQALGAVAIALLGVILIALGRRLRD
jgi:uncharacterized membrane protein